nr:cyanophycin synthetase [bacterium]
SIETIAATKYELVASLPADGCAFLPADGAWGDKFYQKAACSKVRYGLEGDGLDVSAAGIQTGPWGSRFELIIGDERAMASTCLLGTHNIHNILGAAAVAHRIGIKMDKIIAGIEAVAPIPHRLELVRRDGGITVIDDAYNASPMGTRAALAVLKAFPGRKIIVTPGLVELGRQERDENLAFGRAMAAVCDVALLVGQPCRTQAMADGWREGDGAADGVMVFPSLREAEKHLKGLLAPGDVVLFENDLPDHLEG